MEKRIIDISSIILSRTFYALNWYNISPLYIFIASSLSISLGELGLIPAFFLLGAGIFQIPAGIISYKIGPKTTAMLGMYILSIFTILSAFSWNLYSLLFFRFMVGIGAAMYFSPAIGILKNLFSKSRSGLAMGFYNAAFDLGAGIGIILWGPIALYLGWNFSLVIGGLISLIITIENHIVLPDYRSVEKVSIKSTLLNKNIIFLGLSLAGFWGSYFAAGQLLDTYLQKIGYSVAFAGIVSSFILLFGTIGGPIGGYISDRINKRKIILYVFSILISIILLLIPISNIYLITILSILFGILSVGIFSVLYAVPVDLEEIPEDLIPLSLGMINSIQISIGALAPYIFTYISHEFSFQYGWLFLAIYVIIFLPLLHFVRSK